MIETGRRVKGVDYPDWPYLYHRLAKEYGWTPREVDEVDAETLDWMLGIQKIENELQDEHRKKQEREMKRTMPQGRRRR